VSDEGGREAPSAAAPTRLLGDVADYYTARYRSFGDSARGMDWKDEASQRLRFEVLTRHLDLRGTPSLLDVGCGNGELLSFLEERGIGVHYLGIDVCPEMVEACQRRFGANAAALASTADLAARGWTADYVVASGTFNVKQATADAVWRRYLQRAVCDMYAACRIATVFNIMSARVDRRYDHLYYLEPGQAPAFAEVCGTRRFLVDHSYPLFELTVTLRR
jgi:SAM-dependent methyltransferase